MNLEERFSLGDDVTNGAQESHTSCGVCRRISPFGNTRDFSAVDLANASVGWGCHHLPILRRQWQVTRPLSCNNTIKDLFRRA
jgi:hypothetical protein